ncbi:hypothetical protein [Mycetocola miduiensis]|uniref:Uncharacterized protein n=1 Tax=Mycetocola miduiensis TaxID=995034 RepID=A0A1I5C4T1_9MICO|nr:hypothetical protein [Mycetocola miduiensis]SFN82023.1 hypothetical protein SAMN05216219_2211 [Mycetocola miduiensis]
MPLRIALMSLLPEDDTQSARLGAAGRAHAFSLPWDRTATATADIHTHLLGVRTHLLGSRTEVAS